MTDPLETALADEARLTAIAMIEVIAGQPPMPILTALRVSNAASFDDGLETGLAIGVADVATARRILDYITHHVHEDDEIARIDRDAAVGRIMAAAER